MDELLMLNSITTVPKTLQWSFQIVYTTTQQPFTFFKNAWWNFWKVFSTKNCNL